MKRIATTGLLALALAMPGCSLIDKKDNQKQRSPFSTAFRDYEDGIVNGKKDGRIALEELTGKNDTFYLPDEDMIRFASRIQGEKGNTVQFTLYNESGEAVLQKEGLVKSDDFTKYFGAHADDLSQRVSGSEKYTAKFEIVENEQNREIDSYEVTFKN